MGAGGSYPDITLLPVLARTLGVDLNTLLSFQEDLTDQEIGMFLNTLHEAARAEGFDAAFAGRRKSSGSSRGTTVWPTA